MKKVSFLAAVLGGLMMLPAVVGAQCPNLDFSYGNFTYWQCYIGKSDIYWMQKSPPIEGQHTIMYKTALEKSGQLYDEKCSKIPKVPNEGDCLFACKLGNSGVGAEAEAIEYEMTVDSSNSLLIVYFAWVMENFHEKVYNPRFKMKIKDASGKVFDMPCADMEMVAGYTDVPLACETSTMKARNWTKVGFSLEKLMGQRIKIYFETWDCTQGAHFGYAYLLGKCLPMRIDLQYCNGQPSARMTAPTGFTSYTWTRSSNPTWRVYDSVIIVPKPLDNEVFTVKVVNELGCEFDARVIVNKTTPVPNFAYGVKDPDGSVPLPQHNWQSWYDTCSRTATFVDRSYAVNGKKDKIRWEVIGANVNNTDSLFTYTFPNPDIPTEHRVRLTLFTTENTCADTTSRLITIYPTAKIKINGKTQLCEGMQDTLKAMPIRSKFIEYNWSWEKKNGTKGKSTGDKIVINGAGTYYLQALDTNGCYAFDTLIVTSLKLEMKVNTTDVACWGEATGHFWHGRIEGGSGAFVSIFWTVWNNTKQIFVDSNVTSSAAAGIDFRNQKAGVYAFYAKDSKGCEIFDTIYIKEPDSLQFFPTHKNTTCSKSNGLIAFEAKGGAVPYSYSLVMPDGSVKAPSSRKDTLFNLPTGIYTLKVIDNNKCEINDVKIEILASPFPTLIVDTIIAARCGKDNGSIELKAYYITGKDTAYAPGPYTYVWTPKKNSTGNILDANIIGMLKAGNYQLHFKDGNNCEIDTAFTVGNFPSPTLSYLVQPETCGRKDGTITLTVESASPDSLTYQWESLSEKSNEATHLKAGIYKVKIRDLSCEIDTNIILKHIDGPTADFVASTYTVPVKGIFTLTDNSQGTPKMWNWNMGDGSSSQTGKVVRHSYQDTGIYHVFMEVTDANNCKDTISKPIRVYNELQVHIPNTFSPNGDKLNDTWKPILSESLKGGYQLTIYDRWGENVFHTTDPNAAWDGNIKGKPAQSNTVYSYRLTVKDLLGKELEYTGFVTVIR